MAAPSTPSLSHSSSVEVEKHGALAATAAAPAADQPASSDGDAPDAEKGGAPLGAVRSHASSMALPPVDRGLRAWLTVLGSFCCMFCTFGWINGA